MKEIVVVALGTGGEELLTLAAVKQLHQAKKLVLRTERHPLTAYLHQNEIQFIALDDLYNQCENFDDFSSAAAVRLLELSRETPLCYAVADPTMDATVQALQRLKPSETHVTVLPGVSHAGRCMAMLGLPRSAVRMYAAMEFAKARVIPTEALLLCEVHSRPCAGDCKLKLLELLPAEMDIFFFTGDEQGRLQQRKIQLCELDRQETYNHLTAVFIPEVELLLRNRFDMDDLVDVMARLCGLNGCPWDREQTHESLLTNLLEECYEFIGAVREQDIDHMYDELGDVLLQVVFHAEIGHQHGEFDIVDVTTAITQKMVERHPHIFASQQADTAEEVLDNWEAIKRKQRGITSTTQAMRDVSFGLSALMRAWKVQHKAAKVGFDFDGAEHALHKVHEEAGEVLANLNARKDPEIELGDLLFSIVNVCRLCGKNPDIALFSATNKFVTRFEGMENAIAMAGKSMKDLTLAEMDVYWKSEKQAGQRF